jgi:signal transduction histidine kinase
MYGRVWKEEKYYNHVGKIQHSVEDMRDMLEDILTISRTERGKLKFNPGYVNLDRVCGDIVEEQKLQAHDEHEIIYNYRAKSEKYYLDEKLIGQILNNLLSNAIKFSPKGGKVEVDIIDEDGILKMRVEDEGLGIPEHEKKTIFEPFSRGNEVSDIKGSGLGTTIMKNAADLHNASIEFESKLGKGTTFVVTFNQTQD